MLKIGEYNDLTIAREASVGLYLSNGENEVLLPSKYCPKDYEIGEAISVFVLKDSEDREVATTESPKVLLNEFAFLKVSAVNRVGAFLDWGMEKELMVPFSEQDTDMEEGRWYTIYMGLDLDTNRLYASSKLSRCLQNQHLSVKEGDKVPVRVYRKTDLGFSVIVNDEHIGLLYENEVFKEVNVGDVFDAYVKKIRSDNKIDLALQPSGYDNFISEGSEAVYKEIEEAGGFIPVTDKSSPEDIYSIFHMSKKAFKKAVGDLYKQRKITISKDGMNLV
jgi:predicted RNA-binding protein (virulence factor B family)